MKNNSNTVQVGDKVILGANNGLGTGQFLVLKVYPGDPIHGLLVQGANGQVWPARVEGTRIVSR
ncbi:MAG: hypothetical protein EBT68_05050 [Verrucomicrobia bacterium]|nr:hypothetical protein [Verrucomicrobiota bacterium]